MSNKQNTAYIAFIAELVNEIEDDKHSTIAQKLDQLESLDKAVNSLYDKSSELIKDKMFELEKRACKQCEGMGEFAYREYFEKCKDCFGTGVEDYGYTSEHERD